MDFYWYERWHRESRFSAALAGANRAIEFSSCQKGRVVTIRGEAVHGQVADTLWGTFSYPHLYTAAVLNVHTTNDNNAVPAEPCMIPSGPIETSRRRRYDFSCAAKRMRSHNPHRTPFTPVRLAISTAGSVTAREWWTPRPFFIHSTSEERKTGTGRLVDR